MRLIQTIIHGQATSDGAGVQLRRYIGTSEIRNLDPFLMLDVFSTDKPQDYIGGFPPHPHRGFETVTYLIDGKMRHQDNAGNQGVIVPGGVQWMTAGRGIIHSEMPEQTNGLLKGFQLWINLPASHKMTPPKYQDFAPEAVPIEQTKTGGQIRVIAGKTQAGTEGPVKNTLVYPTFFDIQLTPTESFNHSLAENDQTFVFVLEGQISIGDRTLKSGELAILTQGSQVSLQNTFKHNSRLILVSGQPIKEPIVQRGPFVMNTQAEIEQAFNDYQQGNF